MKTLLLRFPLAVILAPLTGLQAQSYYATPYSITTIAGDPTAGYGTTDGPARAARFLYPAGVAMDGAGNFYVADTSNHTIRKISAAGDVTTLAGSPGNFGSVDGTGSSARFYYPYGIAVDGSGNVYVGDTANHIIRKVTPAGVVTTFAGAAGDSGSADGAGSTARFYSPQGVAVDGSGNVFVADGANYTIRKITPAGVVTTFAGTAGFVGMADGTGPAARFYDPSGVVVAGDGTVYVSDRDNNTIRKITSAGVVTTFAGSAGSAGGPGSAGSADGTGSAARFNAPQNLTLDSAGNVYVADTSNHTIRKITPAAVVTTLAGAAEIPGQSDGTGNAARFRLPSGVVVDGAGNVYVADAQNCTIRKITAAAAVTTFAGKPGPSGYYDATGVDALFYNPQGVAADGAGNVYVADTSNSVIRKIDAAGMVTTLAGSAGNFDYADGTGSAARFYDPYGVAADSAGTVYVADTFNSTIRKITSGGVVTTFAGTAGSHGSEDGTGAAARFVSPEGVAVDGVGNVYVTDINRHTVRKITAGGVVTTLAGTAGLNGSADGTGSAALFYAPLGVAVDGAGNVYVADLNNHTIRKITAAGVVTTLAGLANHPGYADGTGSDARFWFPSGVAVDRAGTVYVSDSLNNCIRKISPAGVVTTVAGTKIYSGFKDGTGSAAWLEYPIGLALDALGRIYVIDGPSTIRQGQAVAPADFSADSQPDIIWQNTSTGDRGFWLMNGTSFASWVDVGVVSTDWHVAATVDFNGDGQTDILWENSVTGDRGFWLMDGATFASWVDIGIISTDWHIAAAADFNGDDKRDILWENTVTGDRGFWLMDGTTFSSWVDIGVISTALKIVGAADFNADGKTDIVWENTSTGKRVIWLMNGTTFVSSVNLGIVSTDWHIAAVADYNGDGKPDILWENTVTGDRGFWLMDGTTFASWVDIGVVSTDWRIAP